MMQAPQYVVAGVTTAFRVQPTAAFVAPPPPVHLPSLATLADRSSRAARPLPSPRRSLISPWLIGGEDTRPESSVQIQTQTLHAPLESFENLRQAAENQEEEQQQQHQQQQHAATTGAAGSAGLLCLERSMPPEVLRGLGHLANDTTPFKVEVLRAGGGPGVNNDNEQGWLDTLTADMNKLRGSNSTLTAGVEFDPGRNQEWFSSDLAEEAQFPENSGKGRSRRMPDSDQKLGAMPQRQLAVEAHEAVRWLKADIKRVASLFALEASVMSAAAMSSSGDGTLRAVGNRRAGDVTVKLELLNKGKCPRFHLDKVPIRLICTYVGPSTEWLDGYDKQEMENNRSLPPACNLKISGGREARHARPGDVLIFRGQPGEGLAEGGAFGVAHRSPDTVEGQRRLVLTMDIGDLNGPAAAAHPSS